MVSHHYRRLAKLGIYSTSLSNHLINKIRSRKHGALGVLTHEKALTIVGWILDMQNYGPSITL